MPRNEIIVDGRKLPAIYNEEEQQKNRERNRRLKEQSLQGSTGKRTGKTKKISRKSYIARLKVLLAAGIISSYLIGYFTPQVIEKFQDDAIVGTLIKEYQADIIEQNTGRIDDNSGHFYDTSNLAAIVAEAGEENYDKNLFLIYCNIGEGKTNEVIEKLYRIYLQTGECKTLEEYVHSKGYKDTDEFIKETKQKIISEKELEDLQAMLNSEEEKSNSNSKGK